MREREQASACCKGENNDWTFFSKSALISVRQFPTLPSQVAEQLVEKRANQITKPSGERLKGSPSSSNCLACNFALKVDAAIGFSSGRLLISC
jgi:hypothetical protein